MKLKTSKKVHYDSGPNMTPLVDVVMVILIFLMLAGSFAGAEHYLVSNVPFTDKGAGGLRKMIHHGEHGETTTQGLARVRAICIFSIKALLPLRVLRGENSEFNRAAPPGWKMPGIQNSFPVFEPPERFSRKSLRARA